MFFFFFIAQLPTYKHFRLAFECVVFGKLNRMKAQSWKWSKWLVMVSSP